MKGNGNNRRRRLAGAAIRCQPDPRLVVLARQGHDQAFEEIVRRYRAPLVAYASGIVPDHHAEDVVQDALTKAHAALGTSDAEIRLRPWLYTIVRNGALNALRDEPAHDHLDESFDGVPQPPEVAARREELAALTAKLTSLPDPQREAIVKRELEGQSHEEIATSLGISAGAVRGLIYRARTALRNGAGLLIPLPVLRALLGSSAGNPEAATAAGTAAAGLAAGGGGGVALKAGATLGVAVLAVGSGLAIDHRPGKPADGRASAHSSPAHSGDGSSSVRLADPGTGSGREGESSDDSSGPDGHEGPSASSGPGSGSGSGSSGEGSGTGDRVDGGHGGSGPSGDDGGGSGSGSSGSGDDSGGSFTSGDDGSGSSGSGSGDDGIIESSGSGSSGSGTSGSGSSGDGSGETTTTITTDGGDDGGTSGESG